jgi:hypothetical protein
MGESVSESGERRFLDFPFAKTNRALRTIALDSFGEALG